MEDIKRICRICLLQPKKGSLMALGDDFIDQMQARAGVTLSHPINCKWPENICSECAALVKATAKLRTLCQKAEEQLQLLEKEAIDKANAAEQMVEVKGDTSKPPVIVLNGNLDMKLSEMERGTYEVDWKKAKATLEDCIDFIPISPSTSQTLTSFTSFECDICQNVYTEKVKYTAHLKMHSQEKPHECEICHKRFRQTPQLTRHMNSHTGHRPYKCKYCDSSFGDPSTCSKHQRIHTNERPYKCLYCDKSFNYSNVLDVHLKSHTGERPYSCGHCGQRFSQLHHKNSHEKGHANRETLYRES